MSCCTPETPVKRIDVTTLEADFWRSNNGANLPDTNNDHSEAISHNGQVVIGGLTPTAAKTLTVIGDADFQGQIDPNSIVFSDAPVGVLTAFDSTTLGYYKIGVIGTQRALVLMPKTDAVDAVQGRRADGATVVFDIDTLNQRVGIDTATPQAALDAHGDIVFGNVVTLADFPANAVIGTAAATVDATSVVAIAQTTTGIALTLPAPTRTKAGRILFALNTGSQPVSLDGNTITNGKLLVFVWNGLAWYAIAAGGGSAEDFFRSGTAAALVKPDGVTDFTDQISHNGNMGLGIADPSLVRARLDVSGAEILRPVTLANFPANAAIGTAAATVDVASELIIPQTTAGISLTLPAPTQTQAGRLLFVKNTGSQSVTVGGVSIPSGRYLGYIWSGTAWVPQSAGSSEDFFRSGTVAALLTPDGVTDFTDQISHNGNMGLGLADPSLVRARLDVSGAGILRPVTLANFAANAAIGTAAATVDVASELIIPQTTPNIVLSLPSPTQTQAGRILSAVNTGTAQVKVASVYINPSQGASWIWDGGAWRLIGEQPDYINVGASRNVAISDHLKTILAANAITLTVPANLGYMVFRIRQTTNAGVITMAAGAGVTLVAPYGAATLGLAGDYKIVEIIANVCYVA